jgi:hypothetical protein
MATTDTTPYVPASPGDVLTSQGWNLMQIEIKEDIGTRIAAAKEEVKHEGVDSADDAEHFAGMSEKELTDKLDARYAPRTHDHEGQAVYRRFIKEFGPETGFDAAVLEHGFGRFPLVQTYELLDVVPPPDDAESPFPACKILFYYGHADADRYGLRERVGRDRVPVGLPFEQLLTELAVKWEDDDTIEDVLNDLRNAFMADPNDEIKHCETDWMSRCCGERRTVGELKEADQWSDLYLGIRPRMCGRGADLLPTAGAPACHVDIAHANYDSVVVRVKTAEIGLGYPWPMDLMFLLRA